MEPKFRVEYKMTLNAYRALNSYHSRKSSIFLIVCAAILLVESILLWWFGDADAWLSMLSGLAFLLGVFQGRLLARIAWLGRNKAVDISEYRFCDEGFTEIDEIQESRIKYTALIKLVETNGYFLLYVQKRAAHILPKARFTAGNPEDFAAFLEEKTGKKVIRAHSF